MRKKLEQSARFAQTYTFVPSESSLFEHSFESKCDTSSFNMKSLILLTILMVSCVDGLSVEQSFDLYCGNDTGSDGVRWESLPNAIR